MLKLNLSFRFQQTICLLLGLAIAFTLWQPVVPILPAQASLSNIWNSIFRVPPPRRGIGRGDTCLIAPLPTANVSPSMAFTLSDRPTFVWRGGNSSTTSQASTGKIGVRLQEGGEILWSESLSFNQTNSLHTAHYGGILQPDRVYEVVFLTPTNQVLTRSIRFQALESVERDRISQALNQLNQRLARENVAGEAAAIERANFFAERQLWSDFWQEVLSVESPSQQLLDVINQTVTNLCSD